MLSYCSVLFVFESCLTDFIARAGHASTHALQVLPTHFSLLKTIERSSAMVMASIGHSVTHEPQLMHFSVSTSMSFGRVTVTPFLRSACTISSRRSSGTSARTSPPLLLTCAVRMFMGTFSSRIICEMIGCSTIFSENRMRILTMFFSSLVVWKRLLR